MNKKYPRSLSERLLKINRRQEFNTKILQELLDLIVGAPELRFIQILWAIGIIDGKDRFYEEPWETLERVKLLKERNFSKKGEKGNANEVHFKNPQKIEKGNEEKF